MNKQILQDMLIAFLLGLVTTMLFVFVLGFILGCNQIAEKEKEGIPAQKRLPPLHWLT